MRHTVSNVAVMGCDIDQGKFASNGFGYSLERVAGGYDKVRHAATLGCDMVRRAGANCSKSAYALQGHVPPQKDIVAPAMVWLPKEEAARRLGVSVDTIERRLKRGQLNGKQEPVARGWRWLIELCDDDAPAEASAASANNAEEAPAHAPAGEIAALKELVSTLQEQVRTQHEELDSRRREVQELHVLLQQAQEQANRMLPAPAPPPSSRRRWWHFPLFVHKDG